MIIGITGGSGSGKTTLLNLIREAGGLVMDCDAIYHELLQTSPDLLAAIETRFPGTVENGALNRKRLGAIVFAEETALLELNAITHSAVKQEVLRQLETNPKLAAIDAIGLVESGLAELCDLTVAVIAPEDQRIARLMARDGISEDYARSRIAAQHSDDWFRQHCDFILENAGNAHTYQENCLAFLREQGIM